MDRITSEKQLSAMIMAMLKTRPETNGQLLMAPYTGAINEGRLWACASEKGLAILEIRDFFGLIRFWVGEDEDPDSFADLVCGSFRGGPFVMEAQCGKYTERMNGILSAFEERGFETAVQRRRMTVSAGDASAHLGFAHPAVFAEAGDVRSVRDLFIGSYDIMTGCIPTMAETEDAIRQRRILCVKNGGDIDAVLHFEGTKKKLQVRHIAVKKEYRGLGLAKSLLSRCFADSAAEEYFLWVNCGNYDAEGLYCSFGFRFDGRMSKVMVKK